MPGLTEPSGDWDVIPFQHARGPAQAVRPPIALYRSYFDDASAYVTRASGPAGWSEAILGSVSEEA